ncbi:MAG TPA: FxLYD domain-containing protein [Anaerolineales bacterium]|nr:FxLYD domain-containing protein [Anaerolineales bacterium]
MKRFFLILIVSVLLTACSGTASTPTGNGRRTSRTPVAQLPAQSAQPLATAQPTTADRSSPTPLPVIATASPDSTEAAPAATADPSQPAGLDVISSQGYALNDGFYVVGELLNNTTTPMGNIKITATYNYQRAGKPVVLGTMNGSTMLDVVPSYGKAPFVIGPFVLTVKNGGPVSGYYLAVDGQSGVLPRQDLVVQPTTNSYSTGSWLYVRGEIQNKGTTDAKFVKAVITLYNPDGVIIGAISAYTNPSTISAGGYAPFSASTEYWPNFDHFTVQVQGQ